MSLSQRRGNLFYGRDVATFLRKKRGNLFTADTRKPFETAETWKPFFQFRKRDVETFSKGFHVSEGQKGFHVTAMEQYRGNLLSKKSLKGFHVSLVQLPPAEGGVALLLLLAAVSSRIGSHVSAVEGKGFHVSAADPFLKGFHVSAVRCQKVSTSAPRMETWKPFVCGRDVETFLDSRDVETFSRRFPRLSQQRRGNLLGRQRRGNLFPRERRGNLSTVPKRFPRLCRGKASPFFLSTAETWKPFGKHEKVATSLSLL